ncbi:MAG TPA: phage tail sheath C-terminal domain-containing protein [Myxococcaceae bacterium]|nr:phage tail sheath C-terminal domain-containing protein [Myxococcaceae bacterium]
MPVHLTPGVYVEEISRGPKPIEMVGSSVCAFMGVTPDPAAYPHRPKAINNWSQFVKLFAPGEKPKSTRLAQAVYAFFNNGGSRCFVLNVGESGSIAGRVADGQRQGIAALEPVEEVALVAAPGYADAPSYETLLGFCERTKRCFAILDCPEELESFEALATVATADATPPAGRPATRTAPGSGETPGYRGRKSSYGAYYAPWVTYPDPFDTDVLINIPPSGAMAGIYARVDAERGVHKAPANEAVVGCSNLAYQITREDQGPLNQAGVNVIRHFPSEGTRVWGARTLDDGEWRYINVRRLFIMVRESIVRHTNWVVFEPNDVTLWGSVKRDLSHFLTRLWRDGALMGRTPQEAFFVKCDHETNPPEVIDAGEVRVVVGIAPVKPAEFVIFQIGQHQSGAEVTEGTTNA